MWPLSVTLMWRQNTGIGLNGLMLQCYTLMLWFAHSCYGVTSWCYGVTHWCFCVMHWCYAAIVTVYPSTLVRNGVALHVRPHLNGLIQNWWRTNSLQILYLISRIIKTRKGIYLAHGKILLWNQLLIDLL